MNEFLDEAIRLSSVGVDLGLGGPFGAVVVRAGEILGRGKNEVLARKDPTAHAEVLAIRSACSLLGDFRLSGCDLYASCEPCPMCLGAIFWARIDRVYFASTREDAARAGFDDALFYRELGLPPGARRVPLIHMPSPLAEEALTRWREKADRTAY